MMLLWMIILPGRLGFIVLFSKPETTLQIIMFVFFADLIRPWVLYLCVFLNLWGLLVYFLHTRKESISPYEYKTIRNDALEAGLEESKVETMDKAAGFIK
jgi:hypothetical protein